MQGSGNTQIEGKRIELGSRLNAPHRVKTAQVREKSSVFVEAINTSMATSIENILDP